MSGREMRKQYRAKAEIRDNEIEGAASVTGVIDADNDVIMPGAFRKALREFREHGFIADTHVWRWGSILAMPIEAREHGNELYVKARFHSTPQAQEARVVAQERIAQGLSVGLSIGYGFADEEYEGFQSGQRLLEAALARGYDPALLDVEGLRRADHPVNALWQVARLFEVSLVPVPANPYARATDVKAVSPYRSSIPLAERDRAWDAAEAVVRMRRWAGGPERADVDWVRYEQGFFWHDAENAETFGAYKLPYCDVIGGELHAVPRAIFAVAGVLQGARGGTDIPEVEQVRIRTIVSRWYSRMRDEFQDETLVPPWEREGRALENTREVLLAATAAEVGLAQLKVQQ